MTHQTASWSRSRSKPQGRAGGVLTKSPRVGRTRPRRVWVHLGLEALQYVRVQLHQVLPAHPGVLGRRLVLPPHKVALINPIPNDSGLFIQYSVYLSAPVPLV